MHTKREGKALLRPRFGAQFAQALIELVGNEGVKQ